MIAHNFNSLRSAQNDHHFADDIFKSIFLNKKICISIKMSLTFIPMGLFHNKAKMVRVMAQ